MGSTELKDRQKLMVPGPQKRIISHASIQFKDYTEPYCQNLVSNSSYAGAPITEG
jgi:hypothetical protein